MKSEEIDRYTQVDWHEIFYYDESSKSCLRWKKDFGFSGSKCNNRKDSEAGFTNNKEPFPGSHDYYKVNVLKNRYMVHKIIWYMFREPIPKKLVINHIDCNQLNNKLSNLEVCSEADNQRRRKEHKPGNCTVVSKTGINGVVFRDNKFGGRWIAHWSEDGKVRTKSFSVLKYGKDAEHMAKEARRSAILKLVEKGYGYIVE